MEATTAGTTTKTTWKIDPAHSEIQFKIKYLMITTVTGYFKTFDATVETQGDDFTKAAKIEFTADINSIETNNEMRDTHLKSADFFDAENHSQVKFAGKGYQGSGDEATLNGDLTIRGITKPVVLKVEFGGMITDPYGQHKAGFTLDTKVSRKEFNLMWNGMTEAGQVVVSDEVKIHCEVQLVKQAE